jgi:hypothetical protein
MKRKVIENTPRITTSLITGLQVREMESMVVDNQQVKLSSTKCNFGGKRYWFICSYCRARVGALYRPIGDSEYACRFCKKLSYELTIFRRTREENLFRIVHQLNKRPLGLVPARFVILN